MNNPRGRQRQRTTAAPPAPAMMPTPRDTSIDPEIPRRRSTSCRPTAWASRSKACNNSPGGNALPNTCAPFDGWLNNPYAIRCIDADPNFSTGFIGDEYCILPPDPKLGHAGARRPDQLRRRGRTQTSCSQPGRRDQHLSTTSSRRTISRSTTTGPTGACAGLASHDHHAADDRPAGWLGAARRRLRRHRRWRRLELRRLAAHRRRSPGGHARRSAGERRPRRTARRAPAVLVQPAPHGLLQGADPARGVGQHLVHGSEGRDQADDRHLAVRQPGRREHRARRAPGARVHVLDPGDTRIITLLGHRHASTDRFGVWVVQRRARRPTSTSRSIGRTSRPISTTASRRTRCRTSRQNRRREQRRARAQGRRRAALPVRHHEQQDQALRFANEVFTGEMCILFGSYTGGKMCSVSTRVQ